MNAKTNQIMVTLTRQSVLSQQTDVLVNETDSSLRVPPEWAALAGQPLVNAASMIGWCDIGSAVMTPAGELPVKRIIHAVGPRWGDASARGKLANVTWEILRLTEAAGMTSVAMPSISTGSSGYPVENCAKVMLDQIVDFSFEPITHLKRVFLCLANDVTYDAFASYLHKTDALSQDDADATPTV